MLYIQAVLIFTIFTITLSAQEPKATPKVFPGEAMIENYYKLQVKQIADNCLTDLTTKEDWEKRKPELRRQFLEMVGLWPMPKRTDLKATVTGTVEGEGYVVEKLHFQSWPGLYVTANFYKPKGADPKKPLPTILYVCGHANVVENNVSFGSKVTYQYHPAWFATHGYNCLILDTLQLAEIPGIHHGTYRYGYWWWQCLGYTPAGIELWNAMRAIDYLETRSEVEAKKIGVTGRSGGGATSWWILAGDERPQCFVPVAGIVDLQSYVCEGKSERLKKGVIAGHCDCMFMVNKYRWDFPMVAALAAPRPLLLGNSDVDDIFPVEGYRRLADKVRKVYALYGKEAEEKFQLLETQGPHKDTPELRIGINKWMNRWLKGDTKTKVEDDLPPKLKPQQLKVLEKTPEDSLNANLHDYFIKPAKIDLPASAEVAKAWWPKKQEELIEQLKKECFAGWPKEGKIGLKKVEEYSIGELSIRGFDLTTEPGITLRIVILMSTKLQQPDKIRIELTDDVKWNQLIEDYRLAKEPSAFGKPLTWLPAAKPTEPMDKNREKYLSAIGKLLESTDSAWVYFAPRGIASSRSSNTNSTDDIQNRRRYALLGQTIQSQQVWDVRCAIQAMSTGFPESKRFIELSGTNDLAGIALYASLFEKTVTELTLHEPTTTHREGPIFLNVLKVLDMPQALALAASRVKSVNVMVQNDEGRQAWDWAVRLQQLTGEKSLSFSVKRK